MSSSDSDDEPASMATAATAVRSRPKSKKRCVIINTSQCRYHIVRQAALELGWIIEDDERPDVPSEYAKQLSQTALLDRLFPHFRYHPDDQPQIHWVDVSVLLPKVKALKCFHRLNHFPNMHLICRKMIFFSRCMRLQLRFPEWYTFFPKSFSLRTDLKLLEDYYRSLKGKVKTFVMKPNTGCQGKGILLTRNPLKAAKTLPDQDYIVQLYVHRPLLIDGKKFDMRVYVLMTFSGSRDTFDGQHALQQDPWWLDNNSGTSSAGCSAVLTPTSPASAGGGLQVFIHREGLVRICSETYSKPTTSNLSDVYRHLTNYALNKNNDNFVPAGGGDAERDEDASEEVSEFDYSDEGDGSEGFSGNKRDFRFLAEYMRSNGMGIEVVSRREEWAQAAPATEEENSCGRQAHDDALTDDERDDDNKSPLQPTAADNTSSNPSNLWSLLLQRIDRAVVLSICSAVHEVKQAYHASGALSGPRADGRNAFELMGFDVMVTRSGQVHILEINHSPSLFCDTPLDVRVKKNVIKDTLRIATRGVPDLRKCSDYGYRRHMDRWMKSQGQGGVFAPCGTQFRQVFPLVCPESATAAADSVWSNIASSMPPDERYLLDKRHCENEMNVYKSVWEGTSGGDVAPLKPVAAQRERRTTGSFTQAKQDVKPKDRRPSAPPVSAVSALPSIHGGGSSR